MVSTGWRTAATVIIIIVGAALLTLTAYIWRRQKMRRRMADHPEMQQRFMSSYAGDPESHMPLLYTDAGPPLPPKTQVSSYQRDLSGDVDEWGFRLRTPPVRVPVPPMPISRDPSLNVSEAPRDHNDLDATPPVPVPEPSVLHRLFPTPALIQFPKIQFSRDTTPGRRGRIPSLRIQFLRESNQIVSSPTYAFPEPDKRTSLPESASSVPSTLSRPFATMSTSPLPPIAPLGPISPIDISHTSPSGATPSSDRDASSVAANTERSDSIGSVGHNLFARKVSDASTTYGISRNPSQQSRVSPGSGSGSVSRGNGSASSGSSVGGGGGGGALRRATTWAPNVLASYSPWKGIVQESYLDAGAGAEAGSPSRVESPTGHIRVADAYRSMPTVLEAPENVPAPSMPRPVVDPAMCPLPPSPPETEAGSLEAAGLGGGSSA
ncbi:hypothetical protein C8Q79DRAFT_745557 [Trametes meyenii]|nr:hypothetical protein C8Q79DRAFT_745557 [Trametes meyenii]